MVRRAPLPLEQRQRYRIRETCARDSFVACPEWVEMDGVYEGDIDPSSQDFAELRIRLFNPMDGELTFLVEETMLEEVD
jgi:hypothetical protein